MHVEHLEHAEVTHDVVHPAGLERGDLAVGRGDQRLAAIAASRNGRRRCRASSLPRSRANASTMITIPHPPYGLGSVFPLRAGDRGKMKGFRAGPSGRLSAAPPPHRHGGHFFFGRRACQP